MASGAYSKCTLQANWFEDRIDNRKVDRESRYLRPLETAIANVVNDQFDPLSRIARVEKPPSYAVPLDGFPPEKISSMRDTLADPKSRKEVIQCPPKPSFVTPDAMDDVCKSMGPATEYNPVLHIRGPYTGESQWETTTRLNFPAPPNASTTTPDVNRSAGLVHKEKEGPNLVRLCGEKYREGDPASDTKTQRAWLYTSDPSIDYDGKPQAAKPSVDNELSVPIGDGAQRIVQARIKERLQTGGKLYLTTTDITCPENFEN